MDDISTDPRPVAESNLTDLLNELVQTNRSRRIYLSPNIPQKQLTNAIKSMSIPDNSNILVLVDNTIMGSGKGGIFITEDAIYLKDIFLKENIRINEVTKFEVKAEKNQVVNINDKVIALIGFTKEEIQPFLDFVCKILPTEQNTTSVPESSISKTQNLDDLCTTVDDYINNAIDRLKSKNLAQRVYITPNIPTKLLENSISTMKIPPESKVLVLTCPQPL